VNAPDDAQGKWSFRLAGVTLLFSAALMFIMQPLLGRLLLPLLGGSPAVWNTCMVFFQGLLLAGYALAHLLARTLPLPAQIAAVAALFALAGWSLPFAVATDVASMELLAASPVVWLLRKLCELAALPMLAVAVLNPLLQSWVARLGSSSTAGAYSLYAMSNAGSLLGLAAYPLVIEPRFALTAQAGGWRTGFMLLGLAVVAVGVLTIRGAKVGPVTSSSSVPGAGDNPTWRRHRTWLLLALAPSALLLGVTQYLTTDIASVPLLWAVPLGLYLATFVIAFSALGARWVALADRATPLLAVATLFLWLTEVRHPAWLLGGLHLAFCFAATLACHGRLAAQRPGESRLTEFYLWLSAGGAWGGMLTALVAPLVFSGVAEYPLAMLLVLALRAVPLCGESKLPAAPVAEEPDFTMGRPWLVAAGLAIVTAGLAVGIPRIGLQPFQLWMVVMFGVPLLGAFLLARGAAGFALALGGVLLGGQAFTALHGETLHRERNFFGTIRVTRDAAGPFNALHHGTTIHGLQFVEPARRREPLAYYHRNGPLGAVVQQANTAGLTANVGVIGLGSGAMAAYARPGERWTFYELDPAMVRLAQAGREFTFLTDATNATVRVAAGDARLRLREARDGEFGLLVLDAFGSDTVPVHLLTREAFELYLRKLAPAGLLAMNISSRHLDLAAVVADTVKPLRLFVIGRNDVPDAARAEPGRYSSFWLVLARDPAHMGALLKTEGWFAPETRQPPRPWTDDFADVLSVFRWQ